MSEDWTDDETLSRDETLRRFDSLGPVATSGPTLPAGGSLVTAQTFSTQTVIRSAGSLAAPVMHRGADTVPA